MDIDYYPEYKMFDYYEPFNDWQVSVYNVAADLFPDGLIATYGNDGELVKVNLADKNINRLVYIRFNGINESEKAIREYAKEQADRVGAEIIGRKQKLARLFFGNILAAAFRYS